MGSSISTTETHISNTYNLADSTLNTSGTQSVGSASSKATTDVSPKTDINFSESVNPSWWGNLLSTGRNAGRRIMGTVGNNTDLIQSVKHIAATGLRVAMGDSSFKDKAYKFAEAFINSSTPQGSLTSSEQVSFDTISEAANLQSDIINRLEPVHDAFSSIALGSTGMRNKEVSTMPTKQSLLACYNRASPMEQANSENIIATAGMRLGIIPKNANTPPSSLIIDTFNNAITKYGRVEKVRQDGKKMAEAQNDMLFSILHSPGPILASCGVLRPAYWETNLFIGAIKQNSTPSTAAAYPNGNQFVNKDLVNTKLIDITDSRTYETYVTAAISEFAYSLTADDDSRITRLISSGQLTIVNQVYDPTHSIKIGFVYKNKQDGKFYFDAAVFINTDLAPTKPSTSNTKMATSVHDDEVGHLSIGDETGIYSHAAVKDAKLNNTLEDLKAARAAIPNAEPAVFSYTSQWQVAINMSNCAKFNPIDLFDTGYTQASETQALLVAMYPQGMTLSVAVQVPSLNVTVVKLPQSMKYIGKQYDGSVINLLGTMPDWYSTQDPHDPFAIYYNLMKPVINIAGKIAEMHVSMGAAYRLTCEHVINCRVKSGLPAMSESDLKSHIIVLISDIARWLSNEGPVAPYTLACRKQLFMHIVEKVMLQSMTHVNVYTADYSRLTFDYLRDCEEQNAIERKMDDALNSA